MKSTGIVRKVDELGRVVIPIELRRTLGIDEKDVFEKKCPNIQTAIYDDFFPFPDKSFDIGWGSAVIEHIENREKQLLFLKELQQMHHAVFFLQLSI